MKLDPSSAILRESPDFGDDDLQIGRGGSYLASPENIKKRTKIL